jgi:hypothetical protein
LTKACCGEHVLRQTGLQCTTLETAMLTALSGYSLASALHTGAQRILALLFLRSVSATSVKHVGGVARNVQTTVHRSSRLQQPHPSRCVMCQCGDCGTSETDHWRSTCNQRPANPLRSEWQSAGRVEQSCGPETAIVPALL